MAKKNKKVLDVSFEGLYKARHSSEDERYREVIAAAMSNPHNIEEFEDNLYLELGDVRKIDVANRLMEPDWEDLDMVPTLLTDLCRDPIFLPFVCKYLLNVELLPYQAVWLHLLWTHQYPMMIASRGAAKTFIGAVYLALRALLHQGSRIVVAGAGLRQSMLVFNYLANKIFPEAPILRDICGNLEPKKDPTMANWQVGQSQALFIPIGQGDKIRGLRATHIMMEEFASIDPHIYEVVIQPFAAVRSEGVKNNVREAYIREYQRAARNDGIKEQRFDEGIGHCSNILGGNQIILSGTAQFTFNHFYEYYRKYRAIILGGGDPERIRANFPEIEVKNWVDSKQYCIIRMPVEALPPGLMDKNVISQAKATLDPQIYMMEYGACFPADSEGFILASMIASATCPIGETTFDARLLGKREAEYVMGIDPGSEEDNFTINIIELMGSARGVVYQWACTRKEFEELKRTGDVIPDFICDFVSWCIFHIRNLRRRFNIIRIVLDSSGGGLSIREALKDATKLLDPKDDLVFDMDDENVCDEQGSHILKVIQFSNKEWRDQAHWGLRQDIIDRRLMFPEYDLGEVAISAEKNAKEGKSYDTYENNTEQIEFMKLETIMIRKTQTPTGGEKWDVPKIVGVTSEAIKSRLKRDRFTSLLLANWGGRLIADERNMVYETHTIGGVVGDSIFDQYQGGKRYSGLGARGVSNNFIEVQPQVIELPDGGSIYY